MNKKAQISLMAFMIAIVIILLAVAFTPVMNSFTTQAMENGTTSHLEAVNGKVIYNEFYNNNDEIYNWTAANQIFYGQTFKVSESFTLKSVEIMAYRYLTPGVARVKVFAVNASGLPTGASLSNGSFNATLISNNADTPEIIQVNMTYYTFSPNTKYSFMVFVGNITNGTGSSKLHLMYYLSSTEDGTYLNGNEVYWEPNSYYDEEGPTEWKDLWFRINGNGTVRISDGLRCTETKDNFIKAGCYALDLNQVLFIGGLIALAGVIIAARIIFQ